MYSLTSRLEIGGKALLDNNFICVVRHAFLSSYWQVAVQTNHVFHFLNHLWLYGLTYSGSGISVTSCVSWLDSFRHEANPALWICCISTGSCVLFSYGRLNYGSFYRFDTLANN